MHAVNQFTGYNTNSGYSLDYSHQDSYTSDIVFLGIQIAMSLYLKLCHC